MQSLIFRTEVNKVPRFSAFLLGISLLISSIGANAQVLSTAKVETSQTLSATPSETLPSLFRVEKVTIDAGAELITILARHAHTEKELQGPGLDTPLISVLRDTLGDSNPDNDIFRYVWMHSFTRPSIGQRATAFVPFLYSGASNRKVGSDPPPALVDLQKSDKLVWNKLFWFLFKRMVVDGFTIGPKTSAMQYRQNRVDHHRSAVADSMAALSLFQELGGEKVLSDSELNDIQARLSLTDRSFGWAMQSENLQRVQEEDRKLTRDYRGHNWELLRQYTESQGLYFEPMKTEDGSARHAIVWTTESDVKANQGRQFASRFLNIKNPWKDKRLLDWKGYKQVRWFDAEDRQVDPEAPGAAAKTMIPLALYGLDHPKVPMILVDFRDARNPKYRELSRRILIDVTDNVLSLSTFHSIPYFLGRMVYEFVTGRRGMDLNQASRFRSYAQLKLLLAIDGSLDPEFSQEVARRVNTSSINPLDNDIEANRQIASKQYDNLLAYARQPDGLSKKIQDDRREEMVRLKHSRTERTLFAAANVITFGLYTHREKETPQLTAQMDHRRQLDQHQRFVREVAFNSAGPEIDTDTDRLMESLSYIARYGTESEVKTTRALAKIYSISNAEETRLLCLAGLYRINNSSAKKELLAIYKSTQPTEKSRNVIAGYLKRAMEEGQRISSRDVSSINAIRKAAAN
ncbi:hypothetical protein BH20ACI2_BH20ACI2_09300 [soil metagenome]